ncbi:MAG: ABC transporter ATP-binding protein [Rikenellaceae bacterium]
MIRLKAVDFAYKRGQNLFNSLSLELAQGHIYGLLGKNGSGKSTLLKLISGMICPKGGSIESLGARPFDRRPSFMEQIYYLPEELPTITYSMRKHALLMGSMYPNFSLTELEEHMKEFEVKMDRKLNKLSLGQKKKAAIAFALACNTKILIMDEPTNGLDIPSKSQFRRVVAGIATEERTMVISTHQVRDLESLIDSIVIVSEGEVILNETTDNIGRKLQFKTITDSDSPIYEERNVATRKGIVENQEGDDSKIDIELLFNAATTLPEKIIRVFKTK